MTASALGYHSKLVKEGVDPRSDEYYEKINARMRQRFPENFDDDIEDAPEPQKVKKAANVVAPATRSTAPIKVRLSDTQIALAKRMGVPLADYAKQVALLRRS
jgi:ornithine cyclodeaminase/alanine dehydrogenase-like protein (mu-crystallin family)